MHLVSWKRPTQNPRATEPEGLSGTATQPGCVDAIFSALSQDPGRREETLLCLGK